MIRLVPAPFPLRFRCGCGEECADWPALEEHWYTVHQPPWDIKMQTVDWVIGTVIVLFMVMGALIGLVSVER